MYKYLKIIVLVFLFFLLINPVFAQTKQDSIDLYFFYGNGCPHCEKEEKFLKKLKQEQDNIEIHYFEVWHDSDNANLMKKVAQELNITVTGVPLLIIGDKIVSGYFNDKTTGEEIKSIIKEYAVAGCEDTAGKVISGKLKETTCAHSCEDNGEECLHDCGCSVDFKNKKDGSPEYVSIPFLGEVNIKKLSLPFLTFVIAAADGFNPCAMWVLLFLISLLIGMKDKKRMWIFGGVFIFSSGVVYFLFLAAWLNIFLFLSFVAWVRIIIALTALGSGGYHLYDAWRRRDGGCHIIEKEKRKKTFDKLRNIVGENKFFVALGGIILLAVAVNLVELVCSAGLPAVYTQVLTLSNLSTGQYYAYLAFYILIFMLDDMLVFFLAMTTLKMKAISTRYTRWSGVIGGVAMLIIGLLLLFKPGWLMFG